jgi:UDP-N-acetyl-D-glucosamine dehydrogenase
VADPLLQRISSRQVCAGVIGLGYVGLPLAVAFARAGVRTVGFDVDGVRTRAVQCGESYIADVAAADVRAAIEAGGLSATTDFGALATVDTVNICVPTPLRKTRDPDLSYVIAAVEQVAAHLRAGQLVVLESTTYPGTVDEVVRPRLEAGGLRAGADFRLAFSPERVDPGSAAWTTRNIPKVVGGIDARSTETAAALYRLIVDTVVPVSSPRVAEMVKLLENTFRAVNIGLVNELALMCRDLDIDVWEVIDAAKTKPFGFMPFYPGPGLGGHCIPIDPFYLSWKARQSGFESRFIELAGQINASMPRYVVERVAEALNSRSRAIRGSRVHLLGMAYKRNVSDVRESPAIDIAELLLRRGAVVTYSDPYVPAVRAGAVSLDAVEVEQALADGVDCVVITTDHRGVDYRAIVRDTPLVVDTRNALAGIDAAHIYRL